LKSPAFSARKNRFSKSDISIIRPNITAWSKSGGTSDACGSSERIGHIDRLVRPRFVPRLCFSIVFITLSTLGYVGPITSPNPIWGQGLTISCPRGVFQRVWIVQGINEAIFSSPRENTKAVETVSLLALFVAENGGAGYTLVTERIVANGPVLPMH